MLIAAISFRCHRHPYSTLPHSLPLSLGASTPIWRRYLPQTRTMQTDSCSDKILARRPKLVCHNLLERVASNCQEDAPQRSHLQSQHPLQPQSHPHARACPCLVFLWRISINFVCVCPFVNQMAYNVAGCCCCCCELLLLLLLLSLSQLSSFRFWNCLAEACGNIAVAVLVVAGSAGDTCWPSSSLFYDLV